MKILVVSQRFYPENFRVNDIVKELLSRGHQVTVLTGLPNYPEGYIYPNYKNGQNRNENFYGANVIRVKEIARRKNIFFRFLNYYSFPFFGNMKIRSIDNDFDVVLVNQLSPIMMVNPAIEYKKSTKTKILMYEMDLWPESLLAGGIKKDSIMYRYYKKVSAKIYSKIDCILVSSKGHIEYIKRLSSTPEIKYLPQYAEAIYSTVLSKKRKDVFTFVFAGNIGKAQNLDNLLDACLLASKANGNAFQVYIVGDGSEKHQLENRCKNMNLDKIVIFPGKKTTEEVIEFYNKADALIVSLENSDYAKATVPGKVQSYMLAGKPIFSIASGETNDLIEEAKCGLTSPSDRIDLISKGLNDFCGLDESILYQFGNNAKQYSSTNFDKKHFVDVIEEELQMLSNK